MIDYDYDRIRTVGEYLTAPSSKLFTDLHSLKQGEFPANYRIVFSCFEELDIKVINDFLIELQKSLTFLDIPNFFVVVVTNNKAVELLLNNVFHEYSHEEQSIEFIYVDAPKVAVTEPITAIFNPPESICAQPWISLDINAKGEFRPCCAYRGHLKKDNGKAFHADTDSFESVYNSTNMKQIREDFRQGRKPDECVSCWNEESVNIISKRQLLKNRFNPYSHNANWEQDNIDNLHYVSVSFGNVCNLKCRICSAHNSSQIATEEIEHSDIANKKEHPAYKSLAAGMWIKDDTATVWNQLLDPNLNFYHLDLAGGEPMLSVRHFKVLQQLVASGRARDITIHYNTNGSIFPIEHIDLFKQFKSIDIALSIDNIGERFEYERPGVTWESVEENIKNYLAINTPSITISIHATINIQNVYYLPELCDWVQAQNFDNVHFSTLHFPSILSISHVTREARDLVLNRLKVYKRTNPASTKFIDNTIRILESAVLSNGQEFCSYMQNLDSIRNVSFAQTHTPIAIAMGYKRASTN